MSTILLSIKPEFVKKILSGEKKVEFRKRGFRREVKHVVIYSTAPVKKIVGYFEVDWIFLGTKSRMWSDFNLCAGITEKEYTEYYKNHDDAVVIGIKNPVRIEPLELSVLDLKRAPQSFCYLTDEQVKQLLEVARTKY